MFDVVTVELFTDMSQLHVASLRCFLAVCCTRIMTLQKENGKFSRLIGAYCTLELITGNCYIVTYNPANRCLLYITVTKLNPMH